MKKMRLVLVMVLAMALAVPMAAFAAADLTVTGDTTIRLGYGENEEGKYELQSNWRTRANLDMRVNKGNVSGYARYRVRSTGFVPLSGVSSQKVTDDWPTNLHVHEAYIDVKGSLLPGTPEFNTRIGRFQSRRLNDWVLDVTRRIGAHVSGLALGPVELDLYHSWDNRNSDKVADAAKGDSVSAIIGKVNVDMVELSGAFVNHVDRSGVDYKSHADYAIGVNVSPASGIKVGAEYANDGAAKVNAWKVSGELDTVPNFAISASTWKIDNEFSPELMHVDTKYENLTMDRTWEKRSIAYPHPWMGEGFSIGAETEQAGLPINLNYTKGTIFEAGPNLTGVNAGFSGRDMSVIEVGTSIANINFDLAFTKIEDVETYTDLKATHKLKGLPLGGDVDLTAVLRMQKDEDSKFAADAVWKAPSGFTLGLHYADYDRVLDWNHNYSEDNLAEGINIGKPGEADGFAITAGYQLNF